MPYPYSAGVKIKQPAAILILRMSPDKAMVILPVGSAHAPHCVCDGFGDGEHPRCVPRQPPADRLQSKLLKTNTLF